MTPSSVRRISTHHLVIRLVKHFSLPNVLHSAYFIVLVSYFLGRFLQDELLWAATWLFRATNDEYYLKYVADNAASMGGTRWAVREFSWDNKYAGVQILLSKVENYFCKKISIASLLGIYCWSIITFGLMFGN